MGAEQNHLCPVMAYQSGSPVGAARAVLARTSDPPCFSVIAMPIVTPALSLAGRTAGS